MKLDRSVRAYRALLRLYPRRFRDEYGADMVRLLVDQLEDEASFRVWGRAALDVAITVPARHLENHRNHRVPAAESATAGRILNILLVLQGLFVAALGIGLILGALDEDPNLPWNAVTGFGFLLAALAFWTAWLIRRRHCLLSLILISLAGIWAMATAWWTPLAFTCPLAIAMAFGTAPWDSIGDDGPIADEPHRLLE